MAAEDRRVEIELVAKDFATQVFERFGTTATREGKKVESSLDRVGRTTKRLVTSLGALTAGFVGFAAASAAVRRGTQAFLEFNRAITEVETILGTGGKTIGQVSDEVKDLALALGENEAIIARGFYQTLSAGITDAADATEVLTVATELAIGGLSETATTVDAITTVLNGYGQSADQARTVSDVLFKSVELGKTRVDELASSLGNVVPFAAQLGVSFEEAAASIVQLTKGGVATAEAVTQVRSAIVALIKNGEEIDALFRDRLGTSFSTADVKARGLVAVLNDLVRATGGNEAELVGLLGRVEAVAATLSLTANEGRGVAEVFRQLQGAAGATKAALETQLLAPFKQLQILSGGLRQGLVEVGRAVTEELVGSFGNSLGEVQDAAARLRDTIASIGPAVGQSITLVGTAAATTLAGLRQSQAVGASILDGLKGAIGDLNDEDRLRTRLLQEQALEFAALAREQAGFTEAAKSARATLAVYRAETELLIAAINSEKIAEAAGRLRALSDAAEGGAQPVSELQARFQEIVDSAAKIGGALDRGLATEAAANLGLDLGEVSRQLSQLEAAASRFTIGGESLEAARERAVNLNIDLEALAETKTIEFELNSGRALSEARALLQQIEALGGTIQLESVEGVAAALGLDPEELARQAGVFDTVLRQEFDRVRESAIAQIDGIRGELASSGFTLADILDLDDAGVDVPALDQLRERFGAEFEGILADAEAAGVEFPRKLVDPLVRALVAPEFRAAISDALEGAAGDGAELAVEPVLDAERIKAAIEELSAEEAVLKLGVELGQVPDISLLRNQAEQAKLAFEGLGAQGRLSSAEVAAAIQLVEERLRAQIQAANDGGEALARFAQAGLAAGAVEAAIAAVTAATEQQAAAAQAAAEATAASQERVAQLQLETLPYYEAQRAGIEQQAAAWEATARASLEATDPAQLERELAAINRTKDALLERVQLEQQLAAERINQQTIGLEVQAGITSAIEAERAAIQAQTEDLLRQAEALGASADELDRIRGAGEQAGEAVGTFGKGFSDAAKAAADPEALGAKTFQTAIGLAGDFGRTLAEGGDAFDAFKEKAVSALLEIVLQAIATQAALNFVPGGGGFGGFFSGLFGGGGAAAEGGIVEGQRVATGGPRQDMANRLALSAPPLGGGVRARAFEHGGILDARGGEPGGLPVNLPRGVQFRSFAEGGVASSPTLALFAEKPGMSEAFVPLGPSRRIPVEFKGGDGPAGGGAGGAGSTTVNLRVESLDPRRAAEVVMGAMPMIQQELASAIASGRAGEMVQAVREVSR